MSHLWLTLSRDFIQSRCPHQAPAVEEFSCDFYTCCFLASPAKARNDIPKSFFTGLIYILCSQTGNGSDCTDLPRLISCSSLHGFGDAHLLKSLQFLFKRTCQNVES